MGRANLNSLLSVASDIGAPEEPAAAPEEQVAPAAPRPATKPADAAVSPRTTRKKAPAAPPRTAAVAETVPHWTEYARLEARLREDQVVQLDALVRRLNKQRSGEGPRITKNTLLRVASDLLIARGDAVVGGTEDEIRASLINN